MVLVAGAVSFVLRLGLERRLAFATLRTVAQLVLVGYLLRWIFEVDSAPLVLGVLGLMTAFAGEAAVGRPARTFQGAYLAAFLTLTVTGFVTTFTVTGAVLGVTPWYRADYVLPLCGMVLGNALTGLSLCLDTLLESLHERRDEVEMELALGATRWEAARPMLTAAIRRGMIPIINSMMVVGVVSIPGMMTGQILAGADPVEAAKYQLVVMFMIAGGTALACLVVALLVYRRLFDAAHRLRAERITRRGK